MSDSHHIFLFGDQVFDYSKKLRDLVHANTDFLLVSFFEQTYFALRSEISKLPQQQRQEFERFANFSELVAHKSSQSLHPALDQALSCAYQLAAFISQHREFPTTTHSYTVGLCTGAIAAAAVASSSSLSKLLPAAVQSVIVAFRIGLCASDAAKGLTVDSKSLTGDWSILCPGVGIERAERAIRDFASAGHLPIPSTPYVSASSDSGVTVSGPPTVLSDFRKSPFLACDNTVSLKIKLPYHAPHLFSEADVEAVLSSTLSASWATQSGSIPTISAATGDTVWARNFRSLLQSAVSDILLRQLRWDKLSQRLSFIASSSPDVSITMHQYAVSAEGAARAALEQGSANVVEPKQPDQSGAGAPDGANPMGRPEKSKIAIIGASGRFPGAENMESFWDLLEQGMDMHKVVPPLHWDAKTHVDPEGKKKNSSATPYGCWLEHPDLFDARFFNISPREAPQIDPAQRLALLTAYEAIEEAGITPGGSPSTQKDRVGVFYGVTSNDWMETNSAQNIDTYFIPGGNRAFIPGRINYCFRFSGPSFSIDTACSSSLAAIHTACNALWRGEIDTAIAGGTNILTNPDFTAGLDKGHFLSRTGNCKTFDDGADGYCRGEGVATIILKRYEDAIAEKDPIQAVIAGAYTNHSADAESITRPHVGAQKDIFRKVLNGAGVDPTDIGYVEMHGTGTQAGDGAEMTSVLEAFAPNQGRNKRNTSQNLYVGSAKSNIGHGEAASGVVSLTKLLLMMRKNSIPPHCGIKTKINSAFPTDLEERRVFIAKKTTPWEKPASGIRKAFLNNFSAAGGNTALLLEDAPPMIDDAEMAVDCRSTHVVTLSAKCAPSLNGNATALLSFLNNLRPDELAALSYTTTARRIHHPHRIVVHGQTPEKIRENLKRAIDAKEGSTRPKSAPKPLFTFTGQGAAYPGMAKQLLEVYSSFKKDIDRFDLMAKSLGFASFKGFYMAREGDISDYSPVVSQLAIVCMEMALARLWMSWGIKPHAVVGHSLGEYAALNAAGVISDADTIYLVGSRAQLLEQNCTQGTHCMLAVRASLAKVNEALAGKRYEIACINGADDVVVSGTQQDIHAIQQVLTGLKIKGTLLNVPFAFHSAQVEPILSDFESAAQGVQYHEPSIPVLSPLNASVMRGTFEVGPNYLAQHCRKTVDMRGAVQAGFEAGLITDKAMVVEIGPHPVVAGMVKTVIPGVNVLPSLKRNNDPFETLTQTIALLYGAGADIAWPEYHRDFESSHKVLKLPAYRWDLKGYWMQYVNDWSLRKGDPPLVADGSAIPVAPSPVQQKAPVKALAPPEPELPRLESTTIHSVIEEKVTAKGGSMILESDISRPDLNPMVQGHKVNGVPLCTPSVYADIALSLGDYLQKRYWPEVKGLSIDVSDMTIVKALIAAPSGAQPLRTMVELDATKKTATCRFQSVEVGGKFKFEHASCVVRFQDRKSFDELNSRRPTIQSRMADLRKRIASGETYVFNKAMVYKMVASLANFDPKYRAIDEIVLDSPGLEASSVADFTGVKEDGEFHTNPAFIDALSQSAGFVMNANDKSNLDVEVYVNHGWQSFELFETLSATKRYQTHVSMSEKPGKQWGGDVLILDGDRLVGAFRGIVLQGCPRRLLYYILNSESNDVSGKKDTKAAAKPSPVQPAVKAASAAKASPTKPAHLVQSAIPASAIVPQQASPSIMKQAQVVQNKATELVKKALSILSEESGIADEELTDGSVLADSGIDSLLSLMITSRLRDELDVDIDSAVWANLETVKDLKELLAKTQGATVVEEVAEESLPVTAKNVELLEERAAPRVPVVSLSPTEQPKAEVQIVVEPEIILSKDNSAMSTLWKGVLDIIAEETGIAADELADDTVFADSGVDSLLSLMITSRLSEELGIAVDQTLFTQCETVKDLNKLLIPQEAVAEPTLASSASSTSLQSLTSSDDLPAVTPATEIGADYLEVKKPSAPVRRATSVILQGRPWASKKTLFLFPDGAGSATSYSNIPKVHADAAVVGLNCPYVRHPQEMMECPVDDLVRSYLDEVKRRQPEGVYNFGGWSAGGILAYRATQMMLEQGERVESLTLIDSPLPKGLDRLPQRFYDHCKAIGLFGQALPSPSPLPTDQLFGHFNGTIEVLHKYHALPLPPAALKKVTIVWATECVMDGVRFPKLPPGPDDTEGMKFLTEPRRDFSAAGWEAYFPGSKVDVTRSEGAHHFSMMQGEFAPKLSKVVREAIGL